MNLRFMQLFVCIVLISLASDASADCSRPELAHQQRDAETVRRLESAWTHAFLTGDTEFEACLLAAAFTEIMRDGSISHLSDELAKAAKNKGKTMPNIALPAINIHLHDDVAVACGISSDKVVDGKHQKSYFADYRRTRPSLPCC